MALLCRRLASEFCEEAGHKDVVEKLEQVMTLFALQTINMLMDWPVVYSDLTLWPFHSHEWPRQNFSLQYQYNIKQTSDESIEKYQLGDYKLIQYQVLQTNITRTV